MADYFQNTLSEDLDQDASVCELNFIFWGINAMHAKTKGSFLVMLGYNCVKFPSMVLDNSKPFILLWDPVIIML